MFIVNGSDHDVDLDSGRVLPPGGRADIDRSERHRAMLTEGLLRLVEPPAPLPAPDPAAAHAAVPQAPAAAPSIAPAEPQAAPPLVFTAPEPAPVIDATAAATPSVVLAPAPAADPAAAPHQES